MKAKYWKWKRQLENRKDSEKIRKLNLQTSGTWETEARELLQTEVSLSCMTSSRPLRSQLCPCLQRPNKSIGPEDHVTKHRVEELSTMCPTIEQRTWVSPPLLMSQSCFQGSTLLDAQLTFSPLIHAHTHLFLSVHRILPLFASNKLSSSSHLGLLSYMFINKTKDLKREFVTLASLNHICHI